MMRVFFCRDFPCMFSGFPLGRYLGSSYLCSVNKQKQTIMKKMMIVTMLSLLTMSSCGTYTANGAMSGSMFGAVIGSAIGGISGGWRGSHVGQVVGMAGGAAVGAAIGAQADKEEQARIEKYRRDRERRMASQRSYDYGDSGFDPTNSADDRIDLDLPETRTAQPVTVKPVTVKPQTVKTPKVKTKKNSQPAKTVESADDVYVL